ncbi:hypothetical protein BDV95DRAFT_611780 [Massariosphaeria phaeospora]|uniref:Uncharacterized protein n=1 Tax=Massariosphaeria phaeospora TaxID=100035 RepID=A0A7C8M3B9_9PLEO|nr:hypothetical protein BDV95DRAFT_611780 [Massariosphaeria phaeospora]
MPRYQNSEAAQRVLEAKVLADPEASFTPNVLCSICQAAISKSKFLAEDFGVVDAVRGGHYSYHETIPHHASIADLEMSASYGCHFCALLSNTPEREFTAWPDESFDVSEEPNSKSWQGLLLVIVSLREELNAKLYLVAATVRSSNHTPQL